MGNNQSSGAKSGSPPSQQSSSGATQTSSSAGSSDAARQQRRDSKDPRNIIPAHTTHRSAAPPEPSLTQAQGSTIPNRPKSSLPATAVSSLSGSPHSNSNASASVKPAEPWPIHDEPSKPVDVPGESASLRNRSDMSAEQMADSHLITSGSITDMYLTRGPPRLPLPIEEEVHTPGSPILGPEEGLEEVPDVEHGTESDGLTRKNSGVSTTNYDDEDSQELRVDRSRPVVPTVIEWKRGGEKAYVTGTIFQWNRKHRLHPVEGKPGCFAATINIQPGTHHIRFVVDSVMKTSPDMPTTVDFGNNLVNYIEVSADEVLRQKLDAVAGDAATTADGKVGAVTGAASEEEQPPKPVTKYKSVPSPDMYRTAIPQYLIDFDQAEDSPAYQNAVNAIEKLPTPPSLPGFLGKPILNAATLMKDDNSVLNMPNHTVLNHLATSSIKNNVLAVCATTRYRSKYVTTIVYKPTSADEG